MKHRLTTSTPGAPIPTENLNIAAIYEFQRFFPIRNSPLFEAMLFGVTNDQSDRPPKCVFLQPGQTPHTGVTHHPDKVGAVHGDMSEVCWQEHIDEGQAMVGRLGCV